MTLASRPQLGRLVNDTGPGVLITTPASPRPSSWTGGSLKDGHRFVDEEAHGYSSMAGILGAQPSERAAMVWDATAMAAVASRN